MSKPFIQNLQLEFLLHFCKQLEDSVLMYPHSSCNKFVTVTFIHFSFVPVQVLKSKLWETNIWVWSFSTGSDMTDENATVPWSWRICLKSTGPSEATAFIILALSSSAPQGPNWGITWPHATIQHSKSFHFSDIFSPTTQAWNSQTIHKPEEKLQETFGWN